MTDGPVVITGANGFVGSHLVEHCVAQAVEVVGITHSVTDLASNKIAKPAPELKAVDLVNAKNELTELIAELQPRFVFHLAAKASVAQSWQAPHDTITQNLQSTENLLEAVRAHSSRTRVLVACSGEEYGPVEQADLPVTEQHPLRPQNPYALSKAQVDLLACFYADAHGLDVIRTRAFNHFGPRQTDTFVAASFARQVAVAEEAGKSDVCIASGNTAVRRDFTDVRDVVRAYWLLLEQASAGAYNVCNGQARAISELLTQLAELTDLNLENKVNPDLLRDNEVMEIRGSHEKLSQATGWQPQIKLEQTLTDTLNWWREQMKVKSIHE